ncbi:MULTISPECIES: hypothetical protein [unclassified Pseudomonas]|uniref:hypothetical protein n=1 Tax=unclassified Pseudomonas TaxID=196821 RepID=UPI00031B53B4|nr:hypothetical protein [Pseudomonas sp. M47T1]
MLVLLIGELMLAIAMVGFCVTRIGAGSRLGRDALLRRVVLFYSALLLGVGGMAAAAW